MNPWHVVMLAGISAAVVGLSLLAFARFKAATTIDWQPLSELNDWQYSAPAGFDAAFLRAAIEKAQECLALTGWSAQAIVDATSNVKVLVRPDKKWWAWSGTKAGEADVEAGTVTVGVDLSALCHELGHLLLWRINGKRDDTHLGVYTQFGIYRAVSVYEAWLNRR